MEPLTNNELETLTLAALGHRTESIARKMGYSFGAIAHYRKRIYYKLECHNITHAVAIAIRKGLI